MNDWLDFFASVIDSLAWPAALAVAIYILRDQLRGLLGTLRRLRYRDLELEFTEQVQALREEAAEANLPPADEDDELLRLASVSPRALVLESWLRVQEEAFRAARRAGLEVTSRDSALHVLRVLQRADRIPSHLRSMLADLRVLRNAAAHEPDFAISPEQALEYSQLSRRLAVALRESTRPTQG